MNPITATMPMDALWTQDEDEPDSPLTDTMLTNGWLFQCSACNDDLHAHFSCPCCGADQHASCVESTDEILESTCAVCGESVLVDVTEAPDHDDEVDCEDE